MTIDQGVHHTHRGPDVSNVRIQDLTIAYRKAKVDLYYSSDQRRLELAEYEADLERNLQRLRRRLNGPSSKWIDKVEFAGTAYVAPKSVKFHDTLADTRWSDPFERWNQSEGAEMDVTAEFRLMSRCSLDMHVMSTLWAMQVGEKFDKALSDSAVASRVRRTAEGAPNQHSSGTFVPYLGPYRKWNKAGVDAMRRAIEGEQRIIAITADATSYFHKLEPHFLLDPEFQKKIGMEKLSEDAQHLNGQFVQAINAWQRFAAEATGWTVKGLPVGLPVSAIVANVALAELDRLIERDVKPLHYGRYVDDMILVIKDDPELATSEQVWDWLSERSNGQLEVTHEAKADERQEGLAPTFSVNFLSKYLSGSSVQFKNEKNRVFHLAGKTGLALIDSIERATNEQSSEWRLLPSIPEDADRVAGQVVHALQPDGHPAANLRSTDDLTASRASFAITLRNMESLEADLDPESWSDHRKAFLNAFRDHIMVPQTFFKLASYYPRVVKMAASAGDVAEITELAKRLKTLCDSLESSSLPSIKAMEGDTSGVWRAWKEQLARETYESFVAATGRLVREAQLKPLREAITQLSPSEVWTLDSEQAFDEYGKLFDRDLGHRAFRSSPLASRLDPNHLPDARAALVLPSDAQKTLPPALRRGLVSLSSLLQFTQETPDGIAFATRPVSLIELYALALDTTDEPGFEAKKSQIVAAIGAARGYSVEEVLPTLEFERSRQRGNGSGPPSDNQSGAGTTRGHEVLTIESKRGGGTRRIAIGMVKTEQTSWTASVSRPPDHSFSRYQQLTEVVNGVLRMPRDIDYLILPELSLPRRWFMRFALRLRIQGVSLISGVEYIHAESGNVHNQAWAALSIDGLGFPGSLLYRHDKQVPAPHEETALWDTRQKVLTPERRWSRPLVIAHGDFRFGLLICSELTNIDYRAHLRGAVDTLFIPEWNQDLSTFEALVESAALDVHAYIVQSNDRRYGDSRIRAPRTDTWERDVLRVRGGTHNYVVAADIDYWSLRSHQSAHRVPKGEFKPTPDGFEISEKRRRRPPSAKS